MKKDDGYLGTRDKHEVAKMEREGKKREKHLIKIISTLMGMAIGDALRFLDLAKQKILDSHKVS